MFRFIDLKTMRVVCFQNKYYENNNILVPVDRITTKFMCYVEKGHIEEHQNELPVYKLSKKG